MTIFGRNVSESVVYLMVVYFSTQLMPAHSTGKHQPRKLHFFTCKLCILFYRQTHKTAETPSDYHLVAAKPSFIHKTIKRLDTEHHRVPQCWLKVELFARAYHHKHSRDKLLCSIHTASQTRQESAVCVVSGGGCKLSLETVWQSLNSLPIDHPRRMASSEEV